MEIDIIDYTAAQLALLSEEQIREVEEAQLKKNRLLRELAEKVQEEKRRLINNGMFISYIWEWTKEYWQERYAEEIGWIRDGVLFYLHYLQGGAGEAPYPLDYSLSAVDRGLVVKNYYLEHYTDATERLEAFRKDKAALRYLGEMYAAMLDYFIVLANKQS